jgi:hypothetical protein
MLRVVVMYECKREKACGKTTSHTHTERDLCEASRGSGVTAVTTCVFDVASLASLPPSLSSLISRELQMHWWSMSKTR